VVKEQSQKYREPKELGLHPNRAGLPASLRGHTAERRAAPPVP